MNNQILLTLKENLDAISTHGEVEVETKRNVLKEELQFYVLNFIYHHPDYSNWIMYGGSALRICHDLDRMSVDLDFEVTHPVTESFLNELKKEIDTHFKNEYGAETELLTIKITTNRGLRLCFHIGDEMGINHPSKQVIVKIDLNHFAAPKTVIERVPINHSQLSFVIKTYNMSSLMASKIAAILLRGQRGGVGGVLYEEKGRDIYDLLWYMTKKAIPDLDYLIAKNIDVKNLRALFDKLTLQINKVNDTNLKQDLSPLFVNQTYVENWLKNWRTTYMRLFKGYIRTVSRFEGIHIEQEVRTDSISFIFLYETNNEKFLRVTCSIKDDWINFKGGDLAIPIDKTIQNLVKFNNNGPQNKSSRHVKLLQYATLFYQKIESYLKKMNHTVFGGDITTKLIRMTPSNLSRKEQIFLSKSDLEAYELEDLLK